MYLPTDTQVIVYSQKNDQQDNPITELKGNEVVLEVMQTRN